MRLLTQEDVNKVLKAMEESFKAYQENDGSEAAEERLQYTNNKIQEEAHELSHVTTKEEAVEEICDLIEIIAVAAQERQITRKEIETARKAKNEKRGAFEKFIILEKVN